MPIAADLLRVPVGPGSLHVARYGHGGPAVALLHGFPTSSFLWRTVAPTLASQGYTVYAIDLLGYGESDRPEDADYSIAAQAGYVDRALATLRVARATVAGVDLGGAVAQRLAVALASRVEALALINSLGLDECPGGDIRAVRRGMVRFAIQLTRGVFGAAPLVRRVLEASVATPAAMPPRLLARYLAPFAGADGVAHLLALARALHPEDVAGLALDTIRVPTLVIWGEADGWLDSGLAERLQRAIPGSSLLRLPGVGRLVPEEAPAQLASLLGELAARSSAATAMT